MAGRLVEQVNRLIQSGIRAGIAGVTEEPSDPSAYFNRALDLVRDRLGRVIVERRRLAQELADLPAKVSGLVEKAQLAVRKGREDLARAAASEIASLQESRGVTETSIAGLDADIALLERAIEEISDRRRGVVGVAADVRLPALLAELDRLAAGDDHRRTS